ncbi:MAG TPA: hypothetical protein VN607_07185 [Gemmatimonadaceae bacterium]|nr:hypothetical protein [Gemmatimonadaceae bacterium]
MVTTSLGADAIFAGVVVLIAIGAMATAVTLSDAHRARRTQA